MNIEVQSIIVYRINPDEQEMNGEMDFGRNVYGRTLHGNFYICDHALVVEEAGDITSVISPHHYYFPKSSHNQATWSLVGRPSVPLDYGKSNRQQRESNC